MISIIIIFIIFAVVDIADGLFDFLGDAVENIGDAIGKIFRDADNSK